VARTKATDAGPHPAEVEPGAIDPAGYTVVARRYRPQRFEDVVGQDHVVQALRNAIRLDRIAQAYLFSGTRGVGKTSIARIFAKCLNCAHGPTDRPDLTCDICQAIAVGQDVDVIEIDGASNNGVEAVRELRQNAGLRPSRARFKIYYIDEVHMLSTGAFNALLKTLEEPPAHVKFFFATTEKNKIPITVLSRCQVFDFAGIAPAEIVGTLAEICRREGIAADAEALQVVARRAGGSMRDAQSLLEQLLSAGTAGLTAEVVHQVLGTAADERVLGLLEALVDRDAGAALTLLDGAAASGVQPVDLLNGVLEFLRDMMVNAAGAKVPALAASPAQEPRLQELAGRWGLDTILAAQQILAEARARLRGSPHGRLLVEMALVRVARLEDLAEVGQLVARLTALEAGTPIPANGAGPSTVKKKLTPPEDAVGPPLPGAAPERTPAPAEGPPASGPLHLDEVLRAWDALPSRLDARLAQALPLGRVRPTAISGPNLLVIPLPEGYNWVADACDRDEGRAKIESALGQLLGRPATIRFEKAATDADSRAPQAPPVRPDELAQDPMVQKVSELFEARLVRIEAEDESDA